MVGKNLDGRIAAWHLIFSEMENQVKRLENRLQSWSAQGQENLKKYAKKVRFLSES